MEEVNATPKYDDSANGAVAKRVLDLTCATLGLILLSPFLAAVALAIRLDSPGGVLFRQQRVGRRFRSFWIYKFRTMVPDAPKRGPMLTPAGDLRVTRIGRILRKIKIDELPQLINVIKGEMSLVGPRPEVPRYVAMFRQDYEAILAVRPGITDLASIKYRNESGVLGTSEDPERTYVQQVLPDKIALAKEYIRRRSLWFDLGLIVRTLLKSSRPCTIRQSTNRTR